MLTETEAKSELEIQKEDCQVSLIAAAIRTPLYQMFLDSLKGTSVNIEVVFAGHVNPDVELVVPDNVSFKYILTGRIKPAQAYEVSRRASTGEVIVWVADDCEFKNDVIGKAYRYWKSLNNEKAVLSIQTKEYYLTSPHVNATVGANFCDMTLHSFHGGDPNTPRMAPLGMMSRAYLDRLGGIDRRYVCGQYENDIAMRVYADGGQVYSFGDKESYIDIDHIGKQRIVQPGAKWIDFQTRPFARGYVHDRAVLEQSWCGGVGVKKVLAQRTDKHEPFTDEDILTKSQGPKGIWD